MEIDSKVYISNKYQNHDYLNLKLTEFSSDKEWEKAIEIIDDRIKGRYIEPMIQLSNDYKKNGFAITALGCLLIETLYQFENGLPDTNGASKMSFNTQLEKMMIQTTGLPAPGYFEDFYDCFRCGILHQAQTKNGSRLTTASDRILYDKNGLLYLSVPKFLEMIRLYFSSYKKELSDGNYALRKNFVKKMNLICNRLTNDRNSLKTNKKQTK